MKHCSFRLKLAQVKHSFSDNISVWCILRNACDCLFLPPWCGGSAFWMCIIYSFYSPAAVTANSFLVKNCWLWLVPGSELGRVWTLTFYHWWYIFLGNGSIIYSSSRSIRTNCPKWLLINATIRRSHRTYMTLDFLVFLSDLCFHWYSISYGQRVNYVSFLITTQHRLSMLVQPLCDTENSSVALILCTKS